MGTVPRKSPKRPSKARPGKPSTSKSKPASSSARSKPASSSTKSKAKRPPPRQQKTKPALVAPKKKKRVYTAEELGIPKLNMITPVGVQKPKGTKKGKVFVDDKESMMTILAMVNADKEGQLESKIMKARQLEEIREAKQKEQEARQQAKKSKLEETKVQVQQERKQKKRGIRQVDSNDATRSDAASPLKRRKRVAFK